MFANKRLRESQKAFQTWAERAPVEPRWNLWRDFRNHIWRKAPNVMTKQDCNGSAKAQAEAAYAVKYAFLAYAFPWLLTVLGPNMDLPNTTFTQLAQRTMAADGFECFQNMQEILDDEVKFIPMPDDTEVSGFFFRTATRLWNKASPNERVYTLPDWDHRHDLLHLHVIGNVNAYVLRRNLSEGNYELIVLFRGTSNELNAVPEYGEALSNTQLFHLPDFNVDTAEHSTNENEPLFYHHYYCIIMDALPHIYRLLEVLGASDAKRILCAGHSMGGALVVTFAWMVRAHPSFRKFQFRAYAAPYCCNDTAVRLLDSVLEPEQMIEVINADDFVNVQYIFGDEKGFDQSVQRGTKAVVIWMIKQDKTILLSPSHKEMVARCLRGIQRYPEVSLALFLHNVNLEQSSIRGRYSRPKSVVMCKRRVADGSEYVGKSHSEYLDVDMQVLWKPLRDFEDAHYSWFAETGLRVRQNEFRLVALFAEPDRAKAMKILEMYLVEDWEPEWTKS